MWAGLYRTTDCENNESIPWGEIIEAQLKRYVSSMLTSTKCLHNARAEE